MIRVSLKMRRLSLILGLIVGSWGLLPDVGLAQDEAPFVPPEGKRPRQVLFEHMEYDKKIFSKRIEDVHRTHTQPVELDGFQLKQMSDEQLYSLIRSSMREIDNMAVSGMQALKYLDKIDMAEKAKTDQEKAEYARDLAEDPEYKEVLQLKDQVNILERRLLSQAKEKRVLKKVKNSLQGSNNAQKGKNGKKGKKGKRKKGKKRKGAQ